jgi:L,D-peptidoglycan transpeptidase YkuD (ErfK/YbiS/YcfS/YnhG family)
MRHRASTAALTACLLASLALGASPPAQAAAPAIAPAVVPSAPATSVAAARVPASWRCNVPQPTRLHHIADAKQVVLAVADDWHSSYGTLRVFQKVAGTPGTGWCRVVGPVRARFGYHGLAPAKQRRKDTGTTPAGTFRMPFAFGLDADPGAHLTYVRADGNDYWPLDKRSRRTFNTYQSGGVRGFRASESEHIASFGTQYAYAVVLGYNLPRPGRLPNVDKGGAIFLHVNGDGATAGCVSVSRSAMKRILRTLRPAKVPRIVITTKSALPSA